MLGVPRVPLVAEGRLGRENFPRGQHEAWELDFLLPNLWPRKHISAGAGSCCRGGFQAEQQWKATGHGGISSPIPDHCVTLGTCFPASLVQLRALLLN